MQNVNILRTKNVTLRNLRNFVEKQIEIVQQVSKKYNEIYLLIKYIKSFLWRGPERLSYTGLSKKMDGI